MSSSKNPGLIVQRRNRARAWQITKEMLAGEVTPPPHVSRSYDLFCGKVIDGSERLFFIDPANMSRRGRILVGEWIIEDAMGITALKDETFKFFYEVKK